MNKVLPVLLIFIGYCELSSAQIRKYSNDFLNIGVGARGLGMSNAQISSSNDVTSIFWNPAGLLQIESDIQIAGMHAEYFAGIANYDFAAVGTSLKDSSAIGFALVRMGVDDIPNTLNLIDNNGNIDYDNITTFSASDMAFFFSYARSLPVENLSGGLNAKIIHRKVGDFAKATGFGLDLGARYIWRDWVFAFMGKDITSTYTAWSYTLNQNTVDVFERTQNEIPENGLEITTPTLILGAMKKFQVVEKFSIQPEFNASFTFDGKRNTVVSGTATSIDPVFGIEFGYSDLVFIRGGFGNIQKVRSDVSEFESTTFQPNIGIGLQLKSLSLDYAFTDVGDQSIGLYSHIFSLKLDIFKKEKEVE